MCLSPKGRERKRTSFRSKLITFTKQICSYEGRKGIFWGFFLQFQSFYHSYVTNFFVFLFVLWNIFFCIQLIDFYYYYDRIYFIYYIFIYLFYCNSFLFKIILSSDIYIYIYILQVHNKIKMTNGFRFLLYYFTTKYCYFS